MKGREISFCALAFLAGDFFGGWLTLPPLLFLLLAAIAAPAAAAFRRMMPVLLAFFLLGAASVQVGRMPPPAAESALSLSCKRLRERASTYLGTMVPEGDELAVLRALSVGDKSDISRELRADYRRSGAMHLLALSGLHVGIIYKVLCGVLFFLGWSLPMRRLRSAAVLAALWGFALITGLSPSIARASLMITIYELSSLLRAGRDGVNALAVSALLICLADPEAPRGVGFQLSFCACLSLFTLFPFLRKLLSTRSLLLRYVWECVCVAISCQAATAPLSYLYFGTFPRYFLVTNLLAVPVAAAVLYLLAASLLFARVPLLSDLTVNLLTVSLSLLNGVTRIVAGL
ncbi:MAG: ComEC/Rec2 family competence protein [Bacteroidales bacterium]|nr:ComEC/Rec2 family competence protein [Bacteroidales bacterium]